MPPIREAAVNIPACFCYHFNVYLELLMLDALKRSVGGWAAKILFGMLVLSFAVWGIADIFGGYGRRVIASVGDADVGVETFRIAFQAEIQNAGQRVGRPIGLEEARAAGLHSQVLGNLVAEAALNNDATNMSLGASTETIAQNIVDDPNFRDSFGSFSRSAYEQYLAISGFSESDYVDERRFARLRRQIASAMTAGAVAPAPLVTAFNQFRNETRSVRYLVLGNDVFEPFADADDATLRSYFEENRSGYVAPEYRKLEMILVRAEDLVTIVDISEEELREEYEFRKDSLATDERREVQQLLFDSEEDARAALVKISEGTDLNRIAADRGLFESDITLGLLQQGEIPDPVIGAAAFALEANVVSEPVEGTFGFVLLRVLNIEPASTPTFEDVQTTLKLELAIGRAEERTLDLLDIVEDDRAAGLTFAEIASKNDLPMRTITGIDQTGSDMNGVAIDNIPQQQDVLQVAYEIDPGVEADPIQLVGSGFQWVNVVDVIPARERTFEEVREQLAIDWRNEENAKRLRERSDTFLQAVNNGRSLESVANQVAGTVLVSQPMKRTETPNGFSSELVQAIFATSRIRAASSLHSNGTDRVLFQISDVAVVDIADNAEEAERIGVGLRTSIAEDILATYVQARQNEYGVSVNQPALNVLIGLATPDNQAAGY